MQFGENPYASGVLKPSHHARLVAQLAKYAADANIPPACVWTSMHSDPEVTEAEITYIVQLPRQHLNGVDGLVFVSGGSHRDLLSTMSLMAGCMLRNYAKARVAPLAEVLDRLADGEVPEHKLLLIPDFYLPLMATKTLSQIEVSRLNQLVTRRRALQLQTVVNVSDLAAMRQAYGSIIGTAVENRYMRIDLAPAPSATAA